MKSGGSSWTGQEVKEEYCLYLELQGGFKETELNYSNKNLIEIPRANIPAFGKHTLGLLVTICGQTSHFMSNPKNVLSRDTVPPSTVIRSGFNIDSLLLPNLPATHPEVLLIF